MRYIKLLSIVVCCMLAQIVKGQSDSATILFENLRSRLDGIDDYVADVQVRIDVSFMKVPPLNGKLYFKAPDKMKLERGKGISILPKKNTTFTLNSMFPPGAATVIDAGTGMVDGKKVRIIKVIPQSDATDIILTKIWVDEARNLALKTESTTRDNGTVAMDLEYGKHINKGLPDKVVVHLDVKEYKLPKGVTMDYDTGPTSASTTKADTKNKKGVIEIRYLDYKINTGLKDSFFDEKT